MNGDKNLFGENLLCYDLEGHYLYSMAQIEFPESVYLPDHKVVIELVVKI